MAPPYRTLRGAKDILPAECRRWLWLEGTVREVFLRYGFQELRTPILEAAELFTRSVGTSSDIVRKEMYMLTAGDETICLRPEGTASIARAFIEHSLYRGVGAGYPERYYAMGPMFRHERPQKGRQRQFHQIGVEVLGAAEPAVDAETIHMAWVLLAALGITDCELVLNSVGDGACRPRYRETLRAWLEPRLAQLCPDCQRRYQENPLRVFDCKVEADRALLDQAPVIGDALCEPCATHFAELRRILGDLGVPSRSDPRIVRGLDYYQRTVFEIVSGSLGSQSAVLGGGRYDGLVEALGGPAIPGFGFAIGMERLILLAPEERVAPRSIDLALISLGPAAWEATVQLARRLRERGVGCLVPVAPRPMGAQLKHADRAGARFALFVGQEELARGCYGLKDLRTGAQEEVDEAGLAMRMAQVRP